MRKVLIIISLTLISLSISAQTTSVDNLIDHINNGQVGVAMQWIWYPSMRSDCGDRLIAIGKPATKNLIAVLTDTAKGIIAHFILTRIWEKKSKKAGWNTGSKVNQNEKDNNIKIYLSGLTFYENNDLKVFAKQHDLDKNRARWLTFAANKSSR